MDSYNIDELRRAYGGMYGASSCLTVREREVDRRIRLLDAAINLKGVTEGCRMRGIDPSDMYAILTLWES